MDFRKLLKRMNRGIVLGGVALIVLIIYIIVDNVKFENYKAGIIETLKQYTDECECIYLNDANFGKDGKLSKESKKDMQDEYKKVIEKFWIDEKTSLSKMIGKNKNSMLEDCIEIGKSFDEERNGAKGYIKDAHFTIEEQSNDESSKETYVKKIGPNLVEITVYLKGSFDIVGVPYDVCFSPISGNMSNDIECEYITQFYSEQADKTSEDKYLEDVKSGDESKLIEAKVMFDEPVRFYLSREGKSWKIVEICTDGISAGYKGESPFKIEKVKKDEDKKEQNSTDSKKSNKKKVGE